MVQRNAMKTWNGKGEFEDLLRGDADVAALLSEAEIDDLFDLAYHTRHVDTIFRRVFGIDAGDHR
jgi:adenylosuccinate lyase